MAVNKVVCTGIGTLVDLEYDTITSDMLFPGYTAHAASGEIINGSLDILNMTWNDLAASEYNQEVPAIALAPQYIATNKVVLGNRVLIDLTLDSVSADNVIAGVVFHNGDGHQITGRVRLSELSWTEYANLLQ